MPAAAAAETLGSPEDGRYGPYKPARCAPVRFDDPVDTIDQIGIVLHENDRPAHLGL